MQVITLSHGTSPGDPPVSWTLSQDRRRLTTTKVVHGITVTGTLGWMFDPSDEFIASMIERFRQIPVSDGDVVGQKIKLRRFGPIGIEWETGPPTWRLPRLKVDGGRRWYLRVGWLRLAVGIWRYRGGVRCDAGIDAPPPSALLSARCWRDGVKETGDGMSQVWAPDLSAF